MFASTQLRIARPTLVAALALLWAGAASAVPITLTLESVTVVGGAFESTTEFIPTLPLTGAVGSSDIDFDAGTGLLTLPDYSTIVNVAQDLMSNPNPLDDAQIDIAGWTQTITAIDVAGNITSIGGGSTSCTALAGALGTIVCATVDPNTEDWPPNAGVSATAMIDIVAQTITVIDMSDALAGTSTQNFTYTVVPEPGTMLLLGGGLLGLAASGRRRKQG